MSYNFSIAFIHFCKIVLMFYNARIKISVSDPQVIFYTLLLTKIMKKEDLIKQLANRINQPHVIESWINKIQKQSYDKQVNKALKDYTEWLNENHEGMYCKISDYFLSKYIKERLNKHNIKD